MNNILYIYIYVYIYRDINKDVSVHKCKPPPIVSVLNVLQMQYIASGVFSPEILCLLLESSKSSDLALVPSQTPPGPLPELLLDESSTVHTKSDRPALRSSNEIVIQLKIDIPKTT